MNQQNNQDFILILRHLGLSKIIKASNQIKLKDINDENKKKLNQMHLLVINT